MSSSEPHEAFNRGHTAHNYENVDLLGFSASSYCQAAYPFKGTKEGDLTIHKGEKLLIVKKTRDPNWIKVKNMSGKEGVVPKSYVNKQEPGSKAAKPHQEVKLHVMPWFHGKISRETAEHLLNPREDGLFLVRESANFKGDFTLSVCFKSRIEHYRIFYKENKMTIDEDEFFENLNKLVKHYLAEPDGLVCKLLKPVKKQGGLDYSVNTDDFRKAGWTIQSKDLELGNRIGKGDFGDVYQGIYKGTKVAVKSLKDNNKAAQAFLAEASVMTSIDHPNLIKLLGVVIPDHISNDPISNDPIYVVLEFMHKGALLDYLRSRGRSVVSQGDLLTFAKHVCEGMEYLEKKNLVHRDLAARNILLSSELTAKVSDFGLARSTDVNLEGGLLNGGTQFPVKWTSPEALKKSLFSNKSDVWSFGITLWEMWSFGRVPYPKVPVKVLMDKILKGYRMDSPDNCHQSVYEVMKTCWEQEPDVRPSFRQLSLRLKQINLT